MEGAVCCSAAPRRTLDGGPRPPPASSWRKISSRKVEKLASRKRYTNANHCAAGAGSTGLLKQRAGSGAGCRGRAGSAVQG